MIHMEVMGLRAADQEGKEEWDPWDPVACLPVQAPQRSGAPKMGEVPVLALSCTPNLLLPAQMCPKFIQIGRATCSRSHHQPLWVQAHTHPLSNPVMARAAVAGVIPLLVPKPGAQINHQINPATSGAQDLLWEHGGQVPHMAMLREFYPLMGDPLNSAKKAEATSLFNTLHDPYLAG